MADIFVSYARQDRARVAPLVAAIETQGWTVWWDPEIIPGQEFDRRISAELDAAKAVIVVWSPLSVDSRWVRGEAREAADRGILVPVRFDSARLPIDARAMHTTDLDDWRGDQTNAVFQGLVRALRSLINGSSMTATSGAAQLTMPTDSGRSICVLPFVNMSGDPEQEYFSDGLSEELLNQLTQMKGLRVAARTSCFAFKGQNPDLKLVSDRLGVAHVLEGSVRKAGNRLRITAQLIKAADGYHLWSNTFNRELDDVFAIQEDIARAVADALKITLGMNDSTIAPGITRNVEAYDLYLRAQAMSRQANTQATNRSIILLNEAVKVDPKFVMAWVGLALNYTNLSILAPESAEQSRRLGEEALEMAKSCAPNAANVHALQGTQLFLGRRDWIAAGQAYDKAMQLEPGETPGAPTDPLGVGFPFFLASVGRIAESIDLYRKISRIDPLATLQFFQFILDCGGLHDEAEADYRRCVLLPIDTAVPEYFTLLRNMARAGSEQVKAQFQRYLALNDQFLPIHDEVLARFDDKSAVLALVREASAAAHYNNSSRLNGLAYLAVYFGDEELALSFLRRAFVDLRGITVSAIWHPLFAKLRRTTGFKKLVRDLGLYAYWRSSGHWPDFAKPKNDDDLEFIR